MWIGILKPHLPRLRPAASPSLLGTKETTDDLFFAKGPFWSTFVNMYSIFVSICQYLSRADREQPIGNSHYVIYILLYVHIHIYIYSWARDPRAGPRAGTRARTQAEARGPGPGRASGVGPGPVGGGPGPVGGDPGQYVRYCVRT